MIFVYANSTVPLIRFSIKSSEKETRFDRRFSSCQRKWRVERKREKQRERNSLSKDRRVSMKRAVGQRSSERRKYRFRQNSHSSRPSNPPRVARPYRLTLNYHPYLNFTQQGQKSELRARNSCSTRRRRNLRMKRREEKWEEEGGRGREERAACQPNTKLFIDRCTAPTPLFRSCLSSLFLFSNALLFFLSFGLWACRLFLPLLATLLFVISL